MGRCRSRGDLDRIRDGTLVLSIAGHNEVRSQLEREAIVGSLDMAPDEIAKGAQEAGLPDSIELPTCSVAGEEIDTGSEAKCFADYMRIHALESTGGLSYAQMGRFQSASDPSNRREQTMRQRRPRTPMATRSRMAPATSG